MTKNRSAGFWGIAGAGWTLLEILIASAILATALLPIVSSFHTLGIGFRKSSEATHGAFLAQSVMENIRYRLYDFDSRYYNLNDATEELAKAVQEKAYEKFFRDLAESEGGCAVTESSAGTSRYFLTFENLQGSSLHPIRQQDNPALFRALAGYSATVEVAFDGFGQTLDPDQDSKNELDMARLKVRISWFDQDQTERHSDYETVLTRYLFEPHEAP